MLTARIEHVGGVQCPRVDTRQTISIRYEFDSGGFYLDIENVAIMYRNLKGPCDVGFVVLCSKLC